MLTEAQVAKARTFPGCGDLTADNATDKLFAAADGLQKDLSVKLATAEDNEKLTAKVGKLEGDLLAAKNAVPAQTPAPVLKAMAAASRIQLKSAVDKQAISPAVSEALGKVLIGEGDALSAIGLTPGATGECVATQVFSALAIDGAAPEVGKDAKGQPVPKATPGKIEGENVMAKARDEATAYQNELLRARGLAPAK